VTKEESVKQAITLAMHHYGRLDGAFNNAGLAPVRAPLHEQSMEDFDNILSMNLRAVFMCMKYEIQAMLKTGGGAIVNMSSIGGLVAAPTNSIYASS